MTGFDVSMVFALVALTFVVISFLYAKHPKQHCFHGTGAVNARICCHCNMPEWYWDTIPAAGHGAYTPASERVTVKVCNKACQGAPEWSDDGN